MGLPIAKLICASNANNVLTDFLRTGTYDRNRDFHMTVSPSMDILISSNLERLLYFIAGSEKTAEWMRELKETGKYTVDADTFREIRTRTKRTPSQPSAGHGGTATTSQIRTPQLQFMRQKPT